MHAPPDPTHDELNRRTVITILRARAKAQRQVLISPDMAEWIADWLERHDA